MNPTPAITDASAMHDDPEVVRVLEHYLAELEAKRRPDKRALLAEHPDIADALAECLDGLDFLYKATAPSESRITWPTPDRRLGDYRLQKLIGRGGMGAVYEAEHTITQRRVAIKVLPFAADSHATELRRFQHEIQAAASLDHPHIVPLYEVGEDRGYHFFTMRLVNGGSLADRIARPPHRSTQPNVRPNDLTFESGALEPHAEAKPVNAMALAKWMLQAADALGHAHSLGIVHRDVKPANLLLDDDEQLWVVDFGLAFVPGVTRLTASAALVGTLRYMAPEQVEPRRGIVDQRTDLYGLGATFYELLTGRAAFPDDDRGRVIARILHDEPTPPRRIDPRIPFDLETIVLKLLNKDAARRYGSMAELSDDLRRFLAGRPIVARRPSVLDRTLGWLGRHKRLTAAAAGIALIFVGVLLWNQSRLRHERQQAREVVDDFYSHYVTTVLAREPRLEATHREFLQKALHHYERLADGGLEDRLSVAIAARRVADIHARLGATADAIAAYRRAMAAFEQLPLSDAVRRELAIAHNDRGNLLRGTGAYDEAREDYRAAAEAFQALVTAGSTDVFDRVALAGVENNQGLLWQQLDQRAEAESCFRAARTRLAQLVLEHPNQPRYLAELAMANHNLAETLAATGRYAEAEKTYRETVAFRERVLATDSHNPAYRRELARTQMLFAELMGRMGHTREAQNRAAQALLLWRRLAAEFPDTPTDQVGLTFAYKTFSMCHAMEAIHRQPR